MLIFTLYSTLHSINLSIVLFVKVEMKMKQRKMKTLKKMKNKNFEIMKTLKNEN